MVAQRRITLTTSEVGNGDPNESGTMVNQDGGLAVRIQDEDISDGLAGLVQRFSDEDTRFIGSSVEFTFDVRDLVSGFQYGNAFEGVRLGSQNDDYIFGANDDSEIIFGGMGNDNLAGSLGDDAYVGGLGDDIIDDGFGFDTAFFNTSFAATRLIQGGATTIFSGPEGTDTFIGIEQFRFTDISIGLRPEVYGDLQTGTDSDGVQVAALYDGILGRHVDSLGLIGFADSLKRGATPVQVAEALLNSDEYTARFGDVDAETNAGFVNEIYQVALGRAPDQGGFQSNLVALNAGASRAQIAANIALSNENFAGLTVDETGILVPDADAAAAARLYFGLLDRAPDAGGVANFASFLDGGGTATQAAQAFLNSAEYQAKFAGQSDEAFVDGLYENALGRDPDAGGFEAYTTALENGASRAEVAVAITQSVEAQIHLNPVIEQGWVLV